MELNYLIKFFEQKNNLTILAFLFLFSCSDYDLVSDQKPMSAFSVSTTSAKIDDVIYFKDESRFSPSTWYWNFGDGRISLLQNPEHVFKRGGQFDISLIVSNEFGSDTIVKKGFISIDNNWGTLTDERDGQTYKTVEIGERWWMAENLNYNANVDHGCWAYDNNEEYANIYGRLYNFQVAREACPSGWRLPSNREWWDMEDSIRIGLFDDVKQRLKVKGGEYWILDPNGTNSSGFSALPAGYYDCYYKDCEFSGLGIMARFWTSKFNSGSSYTYSINFPDDYYRGYSFGFSVRCIKDNQ